MAALAIKVLTEQARHRRTYLFRFAVAASGALLLLDAVDSRGSVLGTGDIIIAQLAIAAAWTALLALPALGAIAITTERERDTLPLLLLTRLSPWRLVLELWLAQLAAVGVLLLMLLPLAGIAWALGGIDARHAGLYLAGVVGTMAWTSAVGMACSAWCRSSAVSVPVAFAAVIIALPCFRPLAPGWWIGWYPDWRSPVDPPSLVAIAGRGGWSELLPLLGAQAALTVAALLVARRGLVATPWSSRVWWLPAIRRLDRGLGIAVQPLMPVDRPIAWRIARPQGPWPTRILVLAAIVLTVTGCLAGCTIDLLTNLHFGFPLAQAILATAASLALAVVGAGLFADEREAGTLDLLRCSGLTPRGILREKAVLLRRFHACALGAGLALAAAHAIADRETGMTCGEEILVALVNLVCVPASCAWAGVLFGLAMRSRARATILATLLGVVLTIPLWMAALDPRDNGAWFLLHGNLWWYLRWWSMTEVRRRLEER